MTLEQQCHDLPTIPRPEPRDLADPPSLMCGYEVERAAPVIWPGVVPEEIRRQLVDHWHLAHDAGRVLPAAFHDDVPPAQLVHVPDWFVPSVYAVLLELSEHYRLPYARSSTTAVIGRYSPGAGTDWHLDAGINHPASARRTVSCSVPLNDDFAGGDLEVHPHGPVDLAPGDLCGFTSRTWHRVWPVESGERFALICFGGFPGPDLGQED